MIHAALTVTPGGGGSGGTGGVLTNNTVAAVIANFYTNSTPHWIEGEARLGTSTAGRIQCAVTNSDNSLFFHYQNEVATITALSNTISFKVPPGGWWKFIGLTTTATDGSQQLLYMATNGSVSFATTAGTVTDGVTQTGLAAGSYGPFVVASPTSIYGGSGTRFGINTNIGPGIDSFGGYTRFLANASGVRYYNQDASLLQSEVAPDGTFYQVAGRYINPQTSGGIVGASQQPFGANVQSRLGVIGGDASGLSSLTSHGPDVWQDGITHPQVYITGWWEYGTNYGATEITNDIATIITNGMFTALTNRGLKPTIMLDAAWMQKERIGGLIVVNSNLYPSGMVAFKRYVNSKGFLLEGGIYYTGTLTNSEFVGILGNQSSTDSATDMKVAASTPWTVSKDVNMFYDYFDSIRVADYQPSSGNQQTVGYQLQSLRQWSFFVKYPGGIVPTKRGQTNRLGLSWFMGESPHLIPETAFYINNLCQDQFVVDRTTPVSTAAYGLRYNHTNGSWTIGAGHFMSHFIVGWNQGTTEERASALTNGTYWTSLITAGAMHSATFQLNNSTPNEAFWAMTNSAVMDVYFDKHYHPAWPVFDDSLNSTWVKPLSDGKYAVAMFNQSTTNKTVAFNFTSLTPPRSWRPIQRPPDFENTNTVMSVYNIWAKTNIGYFDSSFEVTVPASNFVWVMLSPVQYKDYTAFELTRNGGAGFCTPTTDGGAPFYVADGVRATSSAGEIVFPVPNSTTNLTLQFKQYSPTTFSMWTNTTSPQYIGGTTRFFSSGGVSQTTVPTWANNTTLSNITITASWPVTNATKWMTLYMGASSNSSVRVMLSPIRAIYE